MTVPGENNEAERLAAIEARKNAVAQHLEAPNRLWAPRAHEIMSDFLEHAPDDIAFLLALAADRAGVSGSPVEVVDPPRPGLRHGEDET